jgi:hypothetical protein
MDNTRKLGPEDNELSFKSIEEARIGVRKGTRLQDESCGYSIIR